MTTFFRLITVAEDGDLILDVQNAARTEKISYKVSSRLLRANSAYFKMLLSPNRFAEGTYFAEATQTQAQTQGTADADADTDTARSSELPHISITDIGPVGTIATIRRVTEDFLRALHGLDLAVGDPAKPSEASRPPLVNLANLVIMADRFQALEWFGEYVRRRRFLSAVEGRLARKGAGAGAGGSGLPEEKVRQKLLVGLLVGHAPWVAACSRRLIVMGSVKWRGDMEGVRVENEGALWWDLPRGVEEELICRREYVLDTISSLQAHFVRVYSSSERQCKLGYDTSEQCDLFQLGQIVKFFSRIDTLKLSSKIYNDDEPAQYEGDIERLLDALKACPERQIDGNHHHCGPREKLVPLVEQIRALLNPGTAGSQDIGICLHCWDADKANHSWTEAKRPPFWSRSTLHDSLRYTEPRNGEVAPRCITKHSVIKDMFTAQERDWTPKVDAGFGVPVSSMPFLPGKNRTLRYP